MARTNNLTDFLNDVSTAIKSKLDDNTPIPAGKFDTKIMSIQTRGNYETRTVNVTSNGSRTITPNQGYDAIESIVINTQVPIPQLQTKSYEFTDNTTITLSPETGYDGFSSVNIAVNVSGGSDSGDVKLFKTVEQMQADPDAEDGNLAVVYRENLQPITKESVFDRCVFPNTVVLDEAFTGNSMVAMFMSIEGGSIIGRMRVYNVGADFDGEVGNIRVTVQYESKDGITYTRTDGGEELQEFGTTIKYSIGDLNDIVGKFMCIISGNYFNGMFEYKNNNYEIAESQLDATADYVYGKTFYGENGVENGTLTNTISNTFTDTNAEVYGKIQLYYNSLTPRVLTNEDLEDEADTNIKIIPCKSDGTPLWNTSNMTDMNQMFYGYSSLTIIPLLDTSNVTDMDSMFGECSSLTTISLLDTSKVEDMSNMFSYCPSLSDDSLNNILLMCVNATNITSNKTLKHIGLTQEQATTCTTLSNYQTFVNAGWTTGY